MTLSTIYALACLVSLVSCRQRPWGFALRSFLLSCGLSAFLPSITPHVVTADLHSSIRDQRGLIRSPTSGYCRGTIPCKHDGCLVRCDAGCSPGFCSLSGVLGTSPGQALPPVSSPALINRNGCPNLRHCATEYQSATTSFDPIGRTTLLGFGASTILALGYASLRVMYSPCEGPFVAVRRKLALRRNANLPKLSGLLMGVG